MSFYLNETSIEWALRHLTKFPASDFFPRSFEFDAFNHNKDDVKKYIASLDLENYSPDTPACSLAIKPNKNFRVVHQLTPIDALIYTSLVYEVSQIVEGHRVPQEKKIACSYRILPNEDGVFFSMNNGWTNFTEQTEILAKEFQGGYILECDITDYYNQIYTHRIQNIFSEAGGPKYEKHAKILEKFIMSLNGQTSRGIPVGPQASIILSEAILSDIDKKILTHTSKYTRYVDDIRLFFKTEEEALILLHELTNYLYSTHRLVFNSIKTRIRKVSQFMEDGFINEEKEENIQKMKKFEEIVLERAEEELPDIGFYGFADIDVYNEELNRLYMEVFQTEEFKILTTTYKEMVVNELAKEKINYGLIKFVLNKCRRYRIRILIPVVLEHFELLVPIVREASLYLDSLIREQDVKDNLQCFYEIFRMQYFKLPYVNMWVCFLLRNKVFMSRNTDGIPIIDERDKILLEMSRNNTTFVKERKSSLDVLAPWEKRAVIFASYILSLDEMRSWLKVVLGKDNITDKSVASYVIALKKSKTQPNKR